MQFVESELQLRKSRVTEVIVLPSELSAYIQSYLVCLVLFIHLYKSNISNC